MDKAAVHDVIRFLPHATTVGMIVVVVLQLAGHLTPGAGLLDVITLGVIGIVARRIVRSWNPGSRGR
jgi:hypothetical protein